jgi:uncharacterized protein YgiM (DUF1202 family)
MRKRYLIVGGLILFAWARLTGEPTREVPSPSLQSEVTSQRTKPTSDKSTPPKSKPSHLPTNSKKSSNFVAAGLRIVGGNRVAFRQGPTTDHVVIDRFDRGRTVLLMESQGEWSRVRDQLTQREGWMASRYLSDNLDNSTKPRATAQPKPKQAPKSLPVVSTSVIIQRIIAESIAAYPGSCPCPYNTDRGGRRCGKRSAYSKPGGYAPICFPQDVTEAMIAAARQRR